MFMILKWFSCNFNGLRMILMQFWRFWYNFSALWCWGAWHPIIVEWSVFCKFARGDVPGGAWRPASGMPWRKRLHLHSFQQLSVAMCWIAQASARCRTAGRSQLQQRGMRKFPRPKEKRENFPRPKGKREKSNQHSLRSNFTRQPDRAYARTNETKRCPGWAPPNLRCIDM